MCSFLDNRGEKSSSPSSKMNCASESDSSVINYAKKLYWYGCFWLGITFPLSSWKIETSKCLGWPENSISTLSVSEAHKSIPAHHRSFFSGNHLIILSLLFPLMPIHLSVQTLHFLVEQQHTPAPRLAAYFSENGLEQIQKQLSVICTQFTSPQKHNKKPGKAIKCLQRNVRSSRKTLLQDILKYSEKLKLISGPVPFAWKWPGSNLFDYPT